MSNNLNKLMERILKKRENRYYYKNINPLVFHVSEAATCTHLVHFRRKKSKTSQPVSKMFSPEESSFALGKAYENYIWYNLPKSNGDFRFHRYYPVTIPLDIDKGFRGNPDIVYQEGQIYIPIEIKTTRFSDLGYFANTSKLLIQGSAYGYGLLSEYWYLIACSKSSKQQTYFSKKTFKPVYKGDTIDVFLRRKFLDLIEPNGEFSPMFSWECESRNSKCEFAAKCPYFEPKK